MQMDVNTRQVTLVGNINSAAHPFPEGLQVDLDDQTDNSDGPLTGSGLIVRRGGGSPQPLRISVLYARAEVQLADPNSIVLNLEVWEDGKAPDDDGWQYVSKLWLTVRSQSGDMLFSKGADVVTGEDIFNKTLPVTTPIPPGSHVGALSLDPRTAGTYDYLPYVHLSGPFYA